MVIFGRNMSHTKNYLNLITSKMKTNCNMFYFFNEYLKLEHKMNGPVLSHYITQRRKNPMMLGYVVFVDNPSTIVNMLFRGTPRNKIATNEK